MNSGPNNLAMCSACKSEPARAGGQRYCKSCHNESEKKRRRETMEIIKAYRAEHGKPIIASVPHRTESV